MKRFSTFINRSKSRSPSYNAEEDADPQSPEATAVGSVRLFCESAGANSSGDEVTHLPNIVDAAESSPAAAASAAQQIRRYLGKDGRARPYVQYNAIMLIRILSDNPGATFTRNFDRSFVSTVKDLLRTGKDPNTQQILRETLDALEADKPADPGLRGLFDMWRKEKGHGAALGTYDRGVRAPAPQPRRNQAPSAASYGNWQDGSQPQQQQQQQLYTQYQHRPMNQLPPAVELAGRTEEAKNTAKILGQLLGSTPSEEVLQNDLIREFAERCQGAQRSMQAYINADSPPPDPQTLQTLIEVNDRLSQVISRHQKAVLAARIALGAATPSPNPDAMQRGTTSAFLSPPPPQAQSGFGPAPAATGTNGSGYSAFGSSTYQSSSPSLPPSSTVENLERRVSPSSPPSRSVESPNDPFQDPMEHADNPAPLAIEPTHYGPPQRHTSTNHPPSRVSRTFSIDSEPLYRPASRDMPDRNTVGTPVSRPSPIASPASPPRPAPYHLSDISRSYVNRQNSAVNGLTMHGAEPSDDAVVVSEIDSHSQQGRRERDREPLPPPPVELGGGGDVGSGSRPGSTASAESPYLRRVDIGGTGGFRDAGLRTGGAGTA